MGPLIVGILFFGIGVLMIVLGVVLPPSEPSEQHIINGVLANISSVIFGIILVFAGIRFALDSIHDLTKNRS